ncbi:MAG: hypothetical protein IT443_09140 [Phycisphaeraceae bacterium]|nr:hypothetical protein [Phycisphaeraceae bacterium]
MSTVTILIAWTLAAGVIVTLAVQPEGGVLYQGPLTVIGLGLIGAGLCIEARKRLIKQDAAARTKR